MADTYKLQYDGMTLTYPGWNGCVSYEAAPAFKTLTLYHSEGGTLTANELTGYPGDTINLSTAYNTYWRFSGYQLTGDGEIVGNDYTFGTEDATICACYKVNAFTATGGFEKGSNVSVTSNRYDAYSNVGEKYATHTSHTGDIPASWYSTSNRWNPSNASAYSITLNPKITLTGTNKTVKWSKTYYKATIAFTAVSLIGSTQSNSQTWSYNNGNTGTFTHTLSYDKTITTTAQTTYGISARLYAKGSYYKSDVHADATAAYIATGTTGGWTATGYAP